ncbi:hypothetical protein AB283_09250 [Lactobacillus amylovorus]|nr:hypothetical protein AB283_09250 [Lactobacillus amylovorus]
MMPDKRKQILSIVGMLILLLILVFSNLGQGTWSTFRIVLLVVGLSMLIVSVIYRIIQILKE